MNFKKGVWIVVFLISYMLNLVAAQTPSIISIDYDFSKNYSSDPTIYPCSSVVLRVNTPIETSCFFTDVENAEPLNPFTENYGTRHEEVIDNLDDGMHKYYIRCNNLNSSGPIMEVVFRTSLPVYAQISLSEEPPLKAGKYEVTLITSKKVLSVPTLEYSFDNLVYKPIALEGEGKVWKGFLIIPENLGDAIVSFKFEAKDLSGRIGNEIKGDNVFIVDTKKPSTIETIKATGYEGQIKLEWFFDEDVKKFNIYRSENQNLDYTDFYKSTNDDSFVDNNVEKGKTYYYRVASVDEAGNIGDLSREVKATVLRENITETTGLAPELIGKVDNALTRIDLTIQDINNIKNSLNLKTEKEKEIFNDLKLNKELDNSLSELNSLKREVGNYKLQDLSENELDNKLNSAELKLNIIKKKVPENLIINEESSLNRDINEEDIREAILEYNQELTERQVEKSVRDSFNLIKEKNLEIVSNLYIVEIVYLDGTTKEISLIKDNLNSELEKLEDTFFIVSIPKDIAESSSQISIQNLDYNIIKSDPVISFDSDTKKIIYSINKRISSDSLNKIKISLIRINKEEDKITGFFVLNTENKASLEIFGIVFLIIVFFILVFYFLYINKKKKNTKRREIEKKIEGIKEFLEKGDAENAKKIYDELKKEYQKLSKKQKAEIYEKIKKLKISR